MSDFNDEIHQSAESEIRQCEREKRDTDDIRHVMSSVQGRRVVWALLEQGKIFGQCFAIDPHVTAFNEGQRNLALALFQRVMMCCPELYMKMADEAGKEE